MRGKSAVTIRILSVYKPASKKGTLSVYAQHRRYFDLTHTPGEVNEIWWDDLATLLQEWFNAGDQIIVSGDINQDVTDSKITEFFEQYNMTERLTNKHTETPETCIRNNRGITIDGIWTTAGIEPTTCGYLPYDDCWDHCPIWIDFTEVEVFGNEEIPTPPLKARRLQLKQIKSRNKYIQHLVTTYKKKIYPMP